MTVDHCLGGNLVIDRLGLGAMRLCSPDRISGQPRDSGISRAVVCRAVDLGVNHIDTSNFYRSHDGAICANSLIREALHPYPPGLVIATKVGGVFRSNGTLVQAHAADMRELVEENLESLGLDCLDLVYLHIGFLGARPGESLVERFEALVELREEGLIRNLGLSGVDAEQISEARSIGPVSAVQNNFHIADRGEVELLSFCSSEGIAFVPSRPFGGGVDLQDERLVTVAARHGATVRQIALAWLLELSPTLLAIPGTGSLRHLEENIAARSITLTEDDMAELG
ncbi:aldo/keto reductase [Nocardia sp. SC052]|uniref:aldo/keto reductase n=1 Tax=Nocardia sichangensis TaxID=3385975 RepID=UPI00399F2351